MFTVPVLEISGDERMELERRARAHTSTQREARRARAILMCAEGIALRQIGPAVGLNEHQVTVWRRRFLIARLDGLVDAPRSGRPRRLDHDTRLKMAAVATSERDPKDPVATWSYLEVTEALREEGIEVSVSQVWHILTAMDIDLSRVRGWLNRRDDPTFWERVRDVCGLYLNPPQRALVLSVDEKTSIQAKQRRYSDQPAEPGQLRRREFEYIRHGTASLFAALDVHRGEVLAEPIPGKNDSINFCAFLDDIDRSVDPTLEIHVVLDNGSSHTSKYTREWFAAHPRWPGGPPGRRARRPPRPMSHSPTAASERVAQRSNRSADTPSPTMVPPITSTFFHLSGMKLVARSARATRTSRSRRANGMSTASKLKPAMSNTSPGPGRIIRTTPARSSANPPQMRARRIRRWLRAASIVDSRSPVRRSASIAASHNRCSPSSTGGGGSGGLTRHMLPGLEHVRRRRSTPRVRARREGECRRQLRSAARSERRTLPASSRTGSSTNSYESGHLYETR